MASLSPGRLSILENPELVIGLTAAVGAPLEQVQDLLRLELEDRGYTVHEIHLSSLISSVLGEDEITLEAVSEFDRIRYLMRRGTELRERAGGGQALALLAAACIAGERPDEPLPVLDGHAFVLRQLKHPEEATWLRRIYQEAFHLIGAYCPEDLRKEALCAGDRMTVAEADELVRIDKEEGPELGQRLQDTFHLSDVFIPLLGDGEATAQQIRRYFRLLFVDLSEGIETPTRDEYGMFLAASASMRSSDLSRQVGAAILRDTGDVVSLGTNEVPSGGGGQYWPKDPGDARDFRMGVDANARIKQEMLREVLEKAIECCGESAEECRSQLQFALRKTTMMDLTEFGRAVHAEMEAILCAGRNGASVAKCHLFSTTFPCHNCAKHIVNSGLDRVVYIEPYPKSRAMELHEDSICLVDSGPEKETRGKKVRFEAFVGVAPRRFPSLFDMVLADHSALKRKDSEGGARREVLGLREGVSALNYIDRETSAAALLRSFVTDPDPEETAE